MDDAFARCVAFMRRMNERMAERTERTAHGVALHADTLPRVWYRNSLMVDLGSDAGADRLVAESEQVQGAAGLHHRKVSIYDELGARLAPDFRRRGWTVQEDLVMVHRRETELPELGATAEVEADDLVPIWRLGIERTFDDETTRQLVASQLERQSAVQVRYLAALTGRNVAAYCELFSDGTTAQIESVMALEEFRGHGFGKAVVARALVESTASGHNLTFLVADAEDWPKELYRKLGFDEVGRIWEFIREPSPEGAQLQA